MEEMSYVSLFAFFSLALIFTRKKDSALLLLFFFISKAQAKRRTFHETNQT